MQIHVIKCLAFLLLFCQISTLTIEGTPRLVESSQEVAGKIRQEETEREFGKQNDTASICKQDEQQGVIKTILCHAAELLDRGKIPMQERHRSKRGTSRGRRLKEMCVKYYCQVFACFHLPRRYRRTCQYCHNRVCGTVILK
ncbi:uncharacterized protein LOC143466010 isoform X2 [Clavelina lepadiformis]|uniref:uncharacterized protein LOC143466010 isoform X2 n=1 Tax=Clavelina lepadiformis TaxID=159417 RepID=UPI004040EB37